MSDLPEESGQQEPRDSAGHFFSMDSRGVAELAAGIGMPRHATDQLLEWVYRKKVTDPAAMTNLSLLNRSRLAAAVRFITGTTVAHQGASDGTQKLLIEWSEPEGGKPGALQPEPHSLPLLSKAVARGRQTECVMIPSEDRTTACISSQLGCPVGCTFCASGIGGLEGNLTCGQIVEQVHSLSCLSGVQRISNVVFMGMGEPLANLASVTAAIRILQAPWGMGISARRITVSTVGLPAAIRKFCDFDLPVTLALSLHAPNDEIRRKIIPWAQFSTIDELLDSCDEWFSKTGREITLEYILLGGVNDRAEHAQELAAHALRIHANVNLIRYNEVAGMPFDRPSSESVLQFQSILRSRKVNAHIRASRGRDIAAACGQLRHEHSQA